MISLMKELRDQNKPTQFLPPLFDSQTCERAFGTFRTMGTLNYIRMNFSIYELLHLVKRLEIINDITYFRLRDTGIEIPNKRIGKIKSYDLPKDEEINFVMNRAKLEAIEQAKAVGITLSETDYESIDNYEFNYQSLDTQETQSEGDDFDMESDFIEPSDERENTDEAYGEGTDNLPSERTERTSRFVHVMDSQNNRKYIRKSTLVWSLIEPFEKLSKDRRKRFIQSGVGTVAKASKSN